jgi:hypothetical protein
MTWWYPNSSLRMERTTQSRHPLSCPLAQPPGSLSSTGHLICSPLVDSYYAANGEHLFTDGRWPG